MIFHKGALILVELFKNKTDCCGCAACASICPTNAILMEPDCDGFIYPKVSTDLCIDCKLCQKVCAFQNKTILDKKPLATYAAINKNEQTLKASSSGGAFTALASLVLEKGGVVFGCAWNSHMETEHICIDNPADIKRLQGSKYVQSRVGNTFIEARQYLKAGRWVLYTGTPCQIAGLKSYLEKNYEKLITVDLICHGVPSATFFKGYINWLEDRKKGTVIEFNFRDKSYGWGHSSKVTYQWNDKVLVEIIPEWHYFHQYFMQAHILRKSCYVCKFACSDRQGDFTIGDYWGIQKAHPEINSSNGVSVLLINSKKGMTLIDKINGSMDLVESLYEKAAKDNGNLICPCNSSSKRDEILKLFREQGPQAVASQYEKENKFKIFENKIKSKIPQPIRKLLKKVLHKVFMLLCC